MDHYGTELKLDHPTPLEPFKRSMISGKKKFVPPAVKHIDVKIQRRISN